MNKTAYIYKLGQTISDGKVAVRLISVNVCQLNTTPTSPKTQVYRDASKTSNEVLWTVMLYLEDVDEQSQTTLKSMMLPAAKALERFLIDTVDIGGNLSSPIFPSAIHDEAED